MTDFKPGDRIVVTEDMLPSIGDPTLALMKGDAGKLCSCPQGYVLWTAEFCGKLRYVNPDKIAHAPKLTTPAEDRALAEDAVMEGDHIADAGKMGATDEQALKDAVVKSAINMRRFFVNSDREDASSLTRMIEVPSADSAAFDQALEALRLFRTPKAEEVPARCEPPEWANAEPYHWIHRGNPANPWVAEWLVAEKRWLMVDYDRLMLGKQSAVEAGENLFVWHSVAKPLPTEQEPTRESVRAWVKAKTGDDDNTGGATDYLFDALRTFKPLPARPDCCNEPDAIEALREIRSILGNSDLSVVEQVRQWAGKPLPAEIVVSDEEIDGEFAYRYPISDAGRAQIRQHVRALITNGHAKLSTPKAETPRLTDEEIDEFRKIHFVARYLSDESKQMLMEFARSIESRARGEK